MRMQFAGAAVPTNTSTAFDATTPAAGGTFELLDATGWPDGSIGPFVTTLNRGLSNEEKVLCSSRTLTTVTISQRGFDGTTPQVHAASTTTAHHTNDATSMDEANAHANTVGPPHVQMMAVDAYTASTTPDLIPRGITTTTSDTAGGWPADYVTIVTIKESEHRCYQQVSDKASNKWLRTGNGTTWATAFVKMASLTSTGALALSDTLTVTRTALSGNDILIQSPTPQIGFVDTDITGGGKNWWFHVNSGNFYLLVDKGGDGAWDSPHPMTVTGSTGAINFGTPVTNSGTVTNASIVSDNMHSMHKKLNGSTHPTALNVMNWGDNTSALTGYLIIKTNMLGVNSMSHLNVTGYSYEGGAAVQKSILDLVISGYLRSGTSGAINGGYTSRGRHVDLVRWAKDASGYYVLIIGSPTDVWRYPQVTVDWFKHRHSSALADTAFNGWTAAVSTDLSPYTYPYDVPDVTPGWSLIKTITPSGLASNTIGNLTWTNIPAHYTRFRLVCPSYYVASTSNSHVYVRFNADSTLNYTGHMLYATSAAESGTYHNGAAQGYLVYSYLYGGSTRTNLTMVDIWNHGGFVHWRSIHHCHTTLTTYPYTNDIQGGWNNTASINRIDVWTSLATTWDASADWSLFGMVQ